MITFIPETRRVLNLLSTFLLYRATQRYYVSWKHNAIAFKVGVLLVEQELLAIPGDLS